VSAWCCVQYTQVGVAACGLDIGCRLERHPQLRPKHQTHRWRRRSTHVLFPTLNTPTIHVPIKENVFPSDSRFPEGLDESMSMVIQCERSHDEGFSRDAYARRVRRRSKPPLPRKVACDAPTRIPKASTCSRALALLKRHLGLLLRRGCKSLPRHLDTPD
jgi:hypothetical protein